MPIADTSSFRILRPVLPSSCGVPTGRDTASLRKWTRNRRFRRADLAGGIYHVFAVGGLFVLKST